MTQVLQIVVAFRGSKKSIEKEGRKKDEKKARSHVAPNRIKME
jgi:hypothetical protein